MKLPGNFWRNRLCVAVILAVVLAETLVHVFRLIPGPDSAGSTYSWTAPGWAVPVEDFNTEMARSQYNPSRGGQWKAGGGGRMTIYYFEWDHLETAPTMVLDGHHADVCNESAGFKFEERLPERVLEGPNGEKVLFDVSRFTDPAGHGVYVFKNIWLANTGNWSSRNKSRWLRLALPFVKRRDSARILMAGIYDSPGAQEAWRTFQSQVLAGIKWDR